MAASHLSPPLLRLPLELRHAIFDHLCSPEPHTYPLQGSSLITAASVSFPISPLPLLLANRALLTELSAYYFTRCTFRFVAQSFRPRSTGKNDLSEASLHVVRKMRRVELLLLPGTVRVAPSDSEPNIVVRNMASTWLDERVSLLRDKAKELMTVIVSIRRMRGNYAWSMGDEMEALLKPLGDLRGRVQFEVGEVMGPSAIEESMRTELAKTLKKLNK